MAQDTSLWLDDLRQLRGYWLSLRGEALIPMRSDVDAREIQHLLNRAFMLDYDAHGQTRIGLAGARLDEVMGAPARGLPLVSLFTGPSKASVHHAVTQMFLRPATVFIQMQSDPSYAGPSTLAQMLILPLRGSGNTVNRAIGIFCPRDEIQLSARPMELIAPPVLTGVEDLSAPHAYMLPKPPSSESTLEPRLKSVTIRNTMYRQAPKSKDTSHLRLVYSRQA